MALTDIEVKKAKTTDKPMKLTDGCGLFLLVQPNGVQGKSEALRQRGTKSGTLETSNFRRRAALLQQRLKFF